MPPVSIILPTYNRAGYLTLAIQSALSQDYEDVNVIVIDDGSTDGTRDVVSGLNDRRVRYIHQSRSGRSTARNRGLAEADGTYIGLLDDDDLYLPSKTRLQVEYLENNPEIDVVGAGTQVIDEYGRLLRVWRTWEDQPELSLLSCLYSCPLIPSTVLFRRGILDDLEEWFDPHMELAEDKDFFVRVLHAGRRIAWLPRIVSAYRVHVGNSQQQPLRYLEAKRHLVEKILMKVDTPEDVTAQAPLLFARLHMLAACHCYAVGMLDDAKRCMLDAWSYYGDQAMVFAKDDFVNTVAEFAITFHVAHAESFINLVFGNLPLSLSGLKSRKNEAQSSAHMRRVFQSFRAKSRPTMSDLFKGIRFNPRWLLNRGVLSIAIKSPILFWSRRTGAHQA